MHAHKSMILTAAAVAITTRCLLISADAFKLVAPTSSGRCIGSRFPGTPPKYSTLATSTVELHRQFKRRRRSILWVAAKTTTLIDQSNATTTSATRLNRNERLFQQRLAELREFRSEHGHGSIPTPYPPNPSLGIWAANLRRQHVLWKQSEEKRVAASSAPYIGYLTDQRRKQLSSAGFDFTSLTERQFQTRLGELKEFKERYGHCMVPEKWDENIALGAWVSNIRSLYKRKRSMQHQRQFHESHLEEDPSHQNNRNGKHRQRRTLLKSSNPRTKRQRSPRFSHLDEERIKLLEDIGFVWSSIDRKWLEMLEWAKVYGVVNYHMKLSEGVGGTYDEETSSAQEKLNGTQLSNQNSTLLLDNYHHFMRNIQDQSLLPSFHPQDEILGLLLDESYAQNDQAHQQQPAVISLSQSDSSNQLDDAFQLTSLDYRIPPNDTLHLPLRIWMINQRSNYNRLDHSSVDQTEDEIKPRANLSQVPSTMTPQRQRALEAINFPWSGRFRHRVEEVQYEIEQTEKMERQREKERRMEQKEREERERVEQLTSSLVASVSVSASGGEDSGSIAAEEDVDIMALWGAEDDDDDW